MSDKFKVLKVVTDDTRRVGIQAAMVLALLRLAAYPDDPRNWDDTSEPPELDPELQKMAEEILATLRPKRVRS